MRIQLLILVVFMPSLLYAQTGSVAGHLIDTDGQPVVGASVVLQETIYGDLSDADGYYRLESVPVGTYRLHARAVRYEPVTQPVTVTAGDELVVDLILEEATYALDEVVVSDARLSPNKQNYFVLSKLPVAARDQPQTISAVDARLLRQQEALSIQDAIKNIPGAYAWATFGGVNNTFGARGYRGITYLKNGVQVSTTQPAVEGVESVQVIKGASAVLFGNVSPGGVINVETKRPGFTPGGRVGAQAGSYGLLRSTFDTWGPLNDARTVAYRLNGVYLTADSYREGVGEDRLYLNPSLAWRFADATTLTLEYDYLLDNRTPDNGTILYEGEIYDLPFSRFMGFETDNLRTEAQSFASTLLHHLRPSLALRGTFRYVSEARGQQRPAAHSNVIDGTSLLRRALTRSEYDDDHATFQVDLLGQGVRTGAVTHDFQVGIDYQQHRSNQLAYNSAVIDTVDVVGGDVRNVVDLPSLTRDYENDQSEGVVGLSAQDVVTFADRVKLALGLRYTTLQSEGARYYFGREETVLTPHTREYGWSPSVGVIYRPQDNLGLFATYTNTFQPTSYVDVSGEPLGNQVTNQVEAGVRSEWFGDRITANLAVYRIYDQNQIVAAFEQDANGVWQDQGYYEQGGDLRNQGVEVDVRAFLPGGLELTTGYSYVDATYLKSDKYADGATPFNTPTHAANLWAYYQQATGALRGLSLGAGLFYTGERWGNDQVKRPWHGIDPDVPTHKLPAFTEVNLALGYTIQQVTLRVGVDNLLDERSYLSYRGNYINPITPRRYSVSLAYDF